MDALILAGAPNNKRLATISPVPYEALISVAGRPMIEYVIGALETSPSVDRLAVVGPPALGHLAGEGKVELLLPCSDDIMANVRNGLEALGDPELALIVTSDIPLLTGAAVEDFLLRAGRLEADFYYSVVEKSVNDAQYPGSERTYVRLKEGYFTGGNILLVNPAVLDRSWQWAQQMFDLRKEPLKMARLFGVGFFTRLLLGQLTIQAVEERFAELLRATGRAIVSPYAEVAIDVDKPEDHRLVERFIAQV